MKTIDRNHTAKPAKIVLSLLFLLLTLGWVAVIKIDRIPWISFLSPEISVVCDNQQMSYEFNPNLMINATSTMLLDQVKSFIDKISWRHELVLGKIDIGSNFSHDGNEYGGIWVHGPAVSITFKQSGKTLSCSSSYEIELIDVRDICADTLKNGVCSHKPFQSLLSAAQ